MDDYDRARSFYEEQYRARVQTCGFYDAAAVYHLRNYLVCLLKLGQLAEAIGLCHDTLEQLNGGSNGVTSEYLCIKVYLNICLYLEGNIRRAEEFCDNLLMESFALNVPLTQDDQEVLQWVRQKRSVGQLVLRPSNDRSSSKTLPPLVRIRTYFDEDAQGLSRTRQRPPFMPNNASRERFGGRTRRSIGLTVIHEILGSEDGVDISRVSSETI